MRINIMIRSRFLYTLPLEYAEKNDNNYIMMGMM